jgi:hypothetical protein
VKGVWGLRFRPFFLLTCNEGNGPINLTISRTRGCGWFWYVFAFGKRWHSK